MTYSRDSVIAEIKNAKPCQFPESFDCANLVPRQVEHVETLG